MLHHSTVRDGVQISALVCKIFLSCHEMCMQKVGRSAVWTNDKSSYKTSSLFTGSRYWNGFNNWKVNIFLFLSIILRLFFSSLQHYQSKFRVRILLLATVLRTSSTQLGSGESGAGDGEPVVLSIGSPRSIYTP